MTPVRTQVLSDLHAELAPGRLPSAAECGTGADLVVVAGDVGRASDAPMLARRMFPDVAHLVLVAGNHEHYGTGMTMDGGVAALRDGAAALSREGARIHVQEDEAAVIAVRDVRVWVLGCTLWTDYALFGAPEAGMAACARTMTDHRLIRGGGGHAVRPEELRLRHARSRRFLTAALAAPWDGPTVVVTHHLPSMRSVAARWRADPVGAGFASALDGLVALGPALWVHGHTHDGAAWRDGGSGTLCVCNPAGYARRDGTRENPRFTPRLTVDLAETDGGWRAGLDASGPVRKRP